MSSASDRARSRAWRGLVFYALFNSSAVLAQSNPVDTTPSRRAIAEALQEGCDGVSVVVRRCAEKAATSKLDKSDDALTRSRARAKAAFDRRDRRARQDALGAIDDENGYPATNGSALRLAPVVVTGNAAEAPPSIEEVLQRALNPQVVSPNGTVTTYGPDGTRTECIARCVGPMCCLTLRNRPDPARESNSIGR